MGEIHRAFYGERGGGHDLLGTSAPALAVVRGVLGATDRPSGSPGEWTPFVSGFPAGDHFVLMRTFPAPVRAGSRSGFVFTDALFIEREDVAVIGDLRLLLGLLSAELPANPGRPESIPATGSVPPPEFTPDRRARAAARELLAAATTKHPVVWLGTDGFEDLLARVWGGLWPEARMGLRFRASFDPADVGKRGLTLVCTDPRSRARWVGFSVVEPSDGVDDPSPAESLLAGEASTLSEFVAELDLRTPGLLALRQAEAAASLLQEIESISPDLLVRLLRLLVVLGPDVGTASDAKTQAVQRVAQAVRGADEPLVHSVRNLPAGPLGFSAAQLEDAVETWVRTHFLTEAGRVGQWLQDDAQPWWTRGVRAGVEGAVREWNRGMGPALWLLWEAAPGEVEAISALTGNHPAAERDLADACPSDLGPDLARRVTTTARHHGWTTLFIVAAAAANKPATALVELLKAFPGEIARALNTLADRHGASVLVDVAVTHQDARVLEQAARAVVPHPSLLAGVDPDVGGWRQLWLRAIQLGADPWNGVPDPTGVRDRLLDRVLNATDVEPSLLEAVAQGRLADLTGHPRRQELWSMLPEHACTLFLVATASAWVERFRASPATEPLPDAPLVEMVRRNPGLLAPDHGDPARGLDAAVTAFQRIPGWQEPDLLRWLQGSRAELSRLSAGSADRLGQFVARRGWRAAASEIYNQRNSVPALRPAIPAIFHVLGILQQWLALLEGLDRGAHPAPDWYDVLLELAIKNYPHGPEQERIWERAGGDSSRLEGGQGRDRWRSAVRLLRSGGAGRDVPKHLAREMSNDFLENAELRSLHDTAP
jgi:hypothetical protein